MINKALSWATENFVQEPPSEYYCPTRDIADARFPRLYQTAMASGLSEDKTALLTAIVAELTANCFDHNLGSWKDVSGCWLSFELTENILQITIADRGQGILQSLQRADASLQTHTDALVTALTKQISGRQPENRGRGLKFVIESLNEKFPSAHFTIQTGDALFEATFPLEDKIVISDITSNNSIVYGTYAKLEIVTDVK